MSEAADVERETEDFFNSEIFGAAPPVENDPAFPGEDPPEAKPLEEVAVDETPTPQEEAEDAEEEEEGGSEPSEQSEPPPDEEPVVPDEEEFLAWAKKQYGDDLDPLKLAKAAFEKEKLLGKRTAETLDLQRQAQERELQEQIDALNTPGILTQEEDTWVNEAIVAPDPAEWAYNALQAERPDLYAAVMDRWSSLGEMEARTARAFHSRVLQAVTAPKPDEQETYTAALGETFTSLGLNIEAHGPLILQKAEELGSAHPAVQGMMSTDENVRLIATRAVFDLVSQGNATVQKAKNDDVIAQRVQEEQLRQQTQGIQQGGPRIEQPKKSKFWEEFETEEDQINSRPQWGKE